MLSLLRCLSLVPVHFHSGVVAVLRLGFIGLICLELGVWFGWNGETGWSWERRLDGVKWACLDGLFRCGVSCLVDGWSKDGDW
jgi:hypothetical protein